MNQDHEKLETLFNQALRFGAADRPAFLAGACGNDEALRKRLEELLAA